MRVEMTDKKTRDLLSALTSLTAAEAVELSRLLEERWGRPAASSDTAAVAQAADAGNRFTVVLASPGRMKIDVIGEIRLMTSLSFEEARDVVEQTPSVVKESIGMAEAQRLQAQLASAGAHAVLISGMAPRTVRDVEPTSRRLPERGLEPDARTAPGRARPQARHPVTDFREEAQNMGVPVAPEPDRTQAAAIVRKIWKRSRDLFPDDEAATKFLFDHPMDDSGRTAVDLVQQRGAAALLIKLDQMRFGANG